MKSVFLNRQAGTVGYGSGFIWDWSTLEIVMKTTIASSWVDMLSFWIIIFTHQILQTV